MKVYLLTQDEANDYDTYDSCIVVAKNEHDAKRIHPIDEYCWCDEKKKFGRYTQEGTWYSYADSWATHPDNVNVEEVSLSEYGLILSSFNAG